MRVSSGAERTAHSGRSAGDVVGHAHCIEGLLRDVRNRPVWDVFLLHTLSLRTLSPTPSQLRERWSPRHGYRKTLSKPSLT
jgi:hypothetical protein